MQETLESYRRTKEKLKELSKNLKPEKNSRMKSGMGLNKQYQDGKSSQSLEVFRSNPDECMIINTTEE